MKQGLNAAFQLFNDGERHCKGWVGKLPHVSFRENVYQCECWLLTGGKTEQYKACYKYYSKKEGRDEGRKGGRKEKITNGGREGRRKRKKQKGKEQSVRV